MNAIVIEHVRVEELPAAWRARLAAESDADGTARVTVRVTVRIEAESGGEAQAAAALADDPLFGMWRDYCEDMGRGSLRPHPARAALHRRRHAVRTLRYRYSSTRTCWCGSHARQPAGGCAAAAATRGVAHLDGDLHRACAGMPQQARTRAIEEGAVRALDQSRADHTGHFPAGSHANRRVGATARLTAGRCR